jgi:hypothetical protein
MRQTSHLRKTSSIDGTILEFVSELTKTDVSDLPPLGETVNADALRLLRNHAFDGSLTFDYATCHITVDYSDPVFVTVSDMTL